MLHTCGRWTLNFLMITLCMRPLKEADPFGVLAAVSRMFGLFAFFYVLLHLSVYLLLDQSGNFGALWQDIVKRPYITIGMLGLLLLIPWRSLPPPRRSAAWGGAGRGCIG